MGQVAQVVEEQEVEVVQFAQLAGQVQIALGGEEFLHQAVGRCEKDGVASFHQAVAQAHRAWVLPVPGSPKASTLMPRSTQLP